MACSGACKASKKLKQISHVIFDMDGVLLDSENIYTQISQNIVSQYGKTFDWSVKVQMMGLHGREVAKKMVKIFDLPITPDEYYEQALIEYDRLMPFAQLMPGAEKIVRHLHANKIPIAVATSSSDASFEIKTRQHKELFSLFNHIVCGGSDPEVKAGKPNPDVFLVCASRFPDKPPSEKCLVLEDAPNGVQAANNAGMSVVMIPDENVPQELRKNADFVVGSLEEVPLDLFGLPALRQKRKIFFAILSAYLGIPDKLNIMHLPLEIGP